MFLCLGLICGSVVLEFIEVDATHVAHGRRVHILGATVMFRGGGYLCWQRTGILLLEHQSNCVANSLRGGFHRPSDALSCWYFGAKYLEDTAL